MLTRKLNICVHWWTQTLKLGEFSSKNDNSIRGLDAF